MTLTLRFSHAFALATAVTIVACDTPQLAGPAPDPGSPRYAVVTNPRATFTYFDQSNELRADGSSSGFITGDNRDASGISLADSSVYYDGLCGVEAQVFIGASGDATLDPIGKRMSGCNDTVRRAITLNYGTPIVGAPASQLSAAHFTNVRQVEQLPFGGPAGNVALRRFRLQLRGTTPCDYLRYGNTVGTDHVNFTTTIAGVVVTSKPMRLEAVAPGRWIATSQPDANGKHVAVCEKASNKGVTYTAAYDIPFRIQVVMR